MIPRHLQRLIAGRGSTGKSSWSLGSDVDGFTDDEEIGLFSPCAASREPAIHLPISFSKPKPPRRRSFCPTLLLLFALSFVAMLLFSHWPATATPGLYEDVWQYEDMLPQHHTRSSRHLRRQQFLRVEGMLTGHGLNNVLQETLLVSHLAYASKRAFVFEDYIWSKYALPYVIDDITAGTVRPSRIPLNAFISGPTAGGPIRSHGVNDTKSADHPRAVSIKYFDSVCPIERRVTISSKDAPTHLSGDKVVEYWTQVFTAYEDVPCLVIDSRPKPVFDWKLLGSKRALPLYDILMHSPILQQFTWSPLVKSALLRNFAMLQRSSGSSDVDLADSTSAGTLPGLVAIHIRRGDYQRHCPRLARQRAQYVGMNQDPSLPDHFDASALRSDELIQQYYLDHCLPSVAQVVEKLRLIRHDNPHLTLDRAYILSNAPTTWMLELELALHQDGWDDVSSTADLKLGYEQAYVGMAVDMAIAERAEVFLGNGFSSLSANVVMLRMAKGVKAELNRLF